MADCAHENFRADVEVNRIAPTADAESPTDYTADIKVVCADCGAAFGWKGPPAGVSWTEPRCSVDALELRAPLMSPAELALAGPLPAVGRGPMIFEVPVLEAPDG